MSKIPQEALDAGARAIWERIEDEISFEKACKEKHPQIEWTIKDAEVCIEAADAARERGALQNNLRETFEALCAMRDTINEHIPLPSLESDLLQGPETSAFCSVVAEAVITALQSARTQGAEVIDLQEYVAQLHQAYVIEEYCVRPHCNGGKPFWAAPVDGWNGNFSKEMALACVASLLASYPSREFRVTPLRLEPGTTPPAPQPTEAVKFPIGTLVKKSSGYQWPGEVRSVFTTKEGHVRYVVECTVAEVAGALHIYSETQLCAALAGGEA